MRTVEPRAVNERREIPSIGRILVATSFDDYSIFDNKQFENSTTRTQPYLSSAVRRSCFVNYTYYIGMNNSKTITIKRHYYYKNALFRLLGVNKQKSRTSGVKEIARTNLRFFLFEKKNP